MDNDSRTPEKRILDPRTSLDRILDDLEPDAIAALHYLAERLIVGQRLYGRLDLRTDPRDWKKEIRAEIGDLLAYFAFEELKHQLSSEGSTEAAARRTTDTSRQAAEDAFLAGGPWPSEPLDTRRNWRDPAKR